MVRYRFPRPAYRRFPYSPKLVAGQSPWTLHVFKKETPIYPKGFPAAKHRATSPSTGKEAPAEADARSRSGCARQRAERLPRPPPERGALFSAGSHHSPLERGGPPSQTRSPDSPLGRGYCLHHTTRLSTGERPLTLHWRREDHRHELDCPALHWRGATVFIIPPGPPLESGLSTGERPQLPSEL